MIRAEIVVVVEMRNGANKQANNSISAGHWEAIC